MTVTRKSHNQKAEQEIQKNNADLTRLIYLINGCTALHYALIDFWKVIGI